MGKKEIVLMEQKLTSQVMDLGKERGITFPDGYNPQNALMSAMLIIKQNKKIQSCDPTSIAESLLNMVTMGLDASVKQCYLIPYGNQAQLSVSYFGTQTTLRRIRGIKDIVSQPIFEGDDVDYDIELGNIINFKHKTKFGNRGKGVIGAYAVITLDEKIYGRSSHIEIMDIEEIRMAWGQGATKGKGSSHTNFPQEMAKKTAINRACKNFINTLTDQNEVNIATAYNSSITDEYERIKVPSGVIEEEIVEQDLSFIEEPAPVTNVDELINEEEVANQNDESGFGDW